MESKFALTLKLSTDGHTYTFHIYADEDTGKPSPGDMTMPSAITALIYFNGLTSTFEDEGSMFKLNLSDDVDTLTTLLMMLSNGMRTVAEGLK